MSTEDYTIRELQTALHSHGFSPGGIDGIYGPDTERAVIRFKLSHGLRGRPYIGPITRGKLFDQAALLQPRKATGSETSRVPPWINEISKYLGKHELANYNELADWLVSDGATLGDPRKYPWCGDAVQTAIANTLPDEPFPGRVGANPYLARNWLEFGEECGAVYGAVAVFWRKKRKGLSGHVAFLVGEDPVRNRLRIRGGNQSNRVSDVWISADRLLGYRRPATYGYQLDRVPHMDATGAVVSTNEA